jgi:hypothetical protein
MANLQVVDYATLQAAVKDVLNREDLTDNVPVFIQDAEAMFSREIRYRSMLVTDKTNVDEITENLPADFLELKEIQFNTNPVVIPHYMIPTQLGEYQSRHPGLGGTPRHFTIKGLQIAFDRVPTGSPELEITSYADIPSLTDAEPTNMLLLDAPDLYKYGTLMMAEVFLKNDPRLATWTAMYQNAKDKLHAADRRAELNPGPQIVQHRRVF